MTPDQTRTLLLVLIGLAVFLYVWRRQEALAYTLRALVIAVICSFIAYLLLKNGGLSDTFAKLAAFVVGGLVILAFPKRSRQPSARVKRQAVTDYEARTGKTFRKGTDDFHHKTPYAEGGSNTADNIEVLGRKENRSKGAKRWRGLGR